MTRLFHDYFHEIKVKKAEEVEKESVVGRAEMVIAGGEIALLVPATLT